MEKDIENNSPKENLALRKGNINFEFLQSEQEEKKNESSKSSVDKKIDRKTDASPQKKGIFFKRNQARTLSTRGIIGVFLVFTLSLVLIFFGLFKAKSFFWLLIIPVPLFTIFWSAIIIILILARPR